MTLSLAERFSPPPSEETPQTLTFYKKPVDETESKQSVPFTVDPPSDEVVVDKVVEGIHKRMREEGRTIAPMAQLCEFEPAFVSDNSRLLPRAFCTAKDFQIFLLTHGYLENFKEDSSNDLPIYELRYKYQTTYGIMYLLAQNLKFKFSVAKATAEYRNKLRERYVGKFANSEPQNTMQSSEIDSRLERIEKDVNGIYSVIMDDLLPCIIELKNKT